MQDPNTTFEKCKTPASSYFTRKAMKIGIASLLAASVALIALSGCGASDSQSSRAVNSVAESTLEGTNTNPATVTESDVTVGTPATTAVPETQPTEEINYDVFPEDVAEGYSFERVLTAQQQEVIIKYNAMSLEEFRALPESEQLTFAYWIFENYKPRFDRIVDEFVETMKSNGKEAKLVKYTFDPETAEEIADNYFYAEHFVYNLFISDGSSEKKIRDLDTAKKCAVLLSGYGQDLFNGIDPTIDNFEEIYSDSYSIGLPSYTEAKMTEEEGRIIVTTSTPHVSPDSGEPEYDIRVFTFNVIEFQDIYGTSISYYQCLSEEYPY